MILRSPPHYGPRLKASHTGSLGRYRHRFAWRIKSNTVITAGFEATVDPINPSGKGICRTSRLCAIFPLALDVIFNEHPLST